MDKINIIFLDTETTGTEEQDRLCQLAFRARSLGDEVPYYKICNELFKPPVPISIGAMSVCHITNEMVADKPSFQGSTIRSWLAKELGSELTCMVAHNAKFDIGMLEKEGILVKHHICTMKVARWLDDAGDLDKTTLQYLRYYHNIKVEADAHDAMGDVIVLEEVFMKLVDLMVERIMKENSEGTTEQIFSRVINKMVQISMSPSLLRKMPFGKHKGMRMSEVPGDYIQWLKKQQDLDEDLRYTLKTLEANKEELPW